MTTNDPVPPGAPISPDGHYWWDGKQWVPVAYQPPLMAEPQSVPAPSGDPTVGYAPPPPGGEAFGGDGDYTATPPKTAQGNPVVVLVAVFLAVGLLAVLFFVRSVRGDEEPATARTTRAPSGAPSRTAATSATPAAAARAQRNIKLVKATLRNAATAQETYATDHNAYTRRLADLQTAGLKLPRGVTVKIVSAGKVRYCLSASVAGKQVHYLDSDDGEPTTKACK
jgi:hypothetical protein